MRKRTRGAVTLKPEQIAREIRVELRSILRSWNDLRQPLHKFETLPDRREGEPRHYVSFDRHARRRVNGMQYRSKAIALPDERILDQVCQFATIVWQLKDRLRQYVKAKGLPNDVEEWADQRKHLLVCADLANWKKHGKHANRSSVDPQLGVLQRTHDRGLLDGRGLVLFDTSKSGALEFFYEGATKEKELLVANPVPIPFRVDILSDDGKSSLGDAVEFIYKAFLEWLPLLRKYGILEGNCEEARELKKLLYPDDIN